VTEAKVQVEATQAEISQAITQYELAKTQFTRSEQLLAKKATSQSAHDEAEANLKNAEAGRKAPEARRKSLDASIV